MGKSRGGNPDILVDELGEVYPEIYRGSKAVGDSIGNLFDFGL